MKALVVDSNVPIVANGRSSQAGERCCLACINALDDLRLHKIIVLDRLGRILDEYRNNLSIDDRGRRFNSDLYEAWELGCLLDIAEITATCALARQESRGAHSREDFPKRDDEHWMVHTLAFRTEDGGLRLTHDKPVDQSLAAEDPRFAPKERVY